MARLRMYVRPDLVRFVLPSRLGQMLLALALLFIGLGLIPAAATWLVGLAWALPWSILAWIAAQPVIGALGSMARPRIEVEVGLHRLVVRRSWLGIRGEGWAAPWDQLDEAHLCRSTRRTARRDGPVELVVVDHRGEWLHTGVRGSPREMGPLLGWVREQIQLQCARGPHDDGHIHIRRLASVLGQARSRKTAPAPGVSVQRS